MDPSFWHDRWAKGQIAFHEGAPNSLLCAHLSALALRPGARIFLPLCGKTRDIAWLLAQGFHVTGAELSQRAIDALFAGLGITPTIQDLGPLRQYSAPGLDLFVGDIFDLPADRLGPVDAVYDRAALVALPRDLRDRYAAHLTAITATAPQLLICFEYDQSAVDGPPFSVPAAEVDRLYAATFALIDLQTRAIEGGLKGIIPAQETIWHLRPKIGSL
ncbi:thiopurine S-methyltransferase [Pseudoruegeria sp. SK021]|uniref:thiopurine S-methyltransferase n=1 Tax=Pseudoruegeria sp. SK021 TaxID=1933035 RepID=UPI000A23D5A3|nr:thiopurine S-methyltransferase [Pseudoruegeria sp. SK021]OSP53841.1 thiopurine S-methyltransferase [Pseudoruegeria sp. SK021]